MTTPKDSPLTIELMPRRWEDSTGIHSAEYYPHIFGNPIPAIAGCEHCKQFRGSDETCGGWAHEPQNAPLFCGPVCPRFDLVDEKRELLEQVWPGAPQPRADLSNDGTRRREAAAGDVEMQTRAESAASRSV